jgi:hypothetical protein
VRAAALAWSSARAVRASVAPAVLVDAAGALGERRLDQVLVTVAGGEQPVAVFGDAEHLPVDEVERSAGRRRARTRAARPRAALGAARGAR